MESLITQSNVTFALGIVAIVFTVYNYFRNPQIRTDAVIIKLQEDFGSLQKQLIEVKETHLRQVENDIKILTAAVNELSKTVVKLSTIIDERIPKK